MHDPSTFRSTDFGRFLLESKLAGTGKEKFMVHWVRRFFDFRSGSHNMSWAEQLPLFLRELNESGSYQDWQVRQADQAVRLYFSNFLAANASGQTAGDASITAMTQTAAVQLFVESMRLRGYARRTEKSYTHWIRRYFAYCKGRSTVPDSNAACIPDLVRDFLAHLAVQRNVSASTQNLAFNSLLMFFRLVFNKDLGDLKEAVRAKTRKRLPVVFSMEETAKLLKHTEGTVGLMLKIIYGGGLRVNECCRLRIKDIDFDQQLIFVRDGKGGKDRSTLLPKSLNGEIHEHMERVIALHDQDLAEGFGSVWLPDALARKYPGHRLRKAGSICFLPPQGLSIPRVALSGGTM